jgi:serine/threonine protein kinase
MGNILPVVVDTTSQQSTENTILSDSPLIQSIPLNTSTCSSNGNYITATTNDLNTKWSNDFIKVNNQIVGQGAFGKVWIVKTLQPLRSTQSMTIVAETEQLDYFAMKEINLDCHIFKISKKNLNYALHEGRKMQNLNHKNIVAYINSYNDLIDQKVYLIMEYANGGSLRDRIHFQLNKKDHYPSTSTYFNENLIWFWLLQILEGIKYIHSKDIIHRDIKPDNIFIDARNGLCKLGDFGLAKILEETNQEFVSQVGTPAYMPPEVHEIRLAQLQYHSIDTINMKTAICSLYSKKGDIYSFGCTIYELTFLKQISFRNNKNNNNDILSQNYVYTDELKQLIEHTLCSDPSKRPSIENMFEIDKIKKRLSQDYSNFYYQQMIPTLNLEKNFRTSIENRNFIRIEIFNEYKPSEMVSLKRGSNLIILSVNKYMNKQKRNSGYFKTINPFVIFGANNDATNKDKSYFYENENCFIESEYSVIDKAEAYDDNIDESKLLVYTEHGELVNELSYYYFDKERLARKDFNFQILGMCVDEIYSHLYVSLNKPSQIYRFFYSTNFSYLILDGILDLNELIQMRNSTPTCLHLPYSSSLLTTNDYRILFFGDRLNKCLTSIKVFLKDQQQQQQQGNEMNYKIKCEALRSVTVDEKFYLSQILTTNDEIICLLNDLATIQIYDLSTYLAKRDNKNIIKSETKIKLRINYFCVDSDFNLYTTNGHSFLCMNIRSLRFYQKFKPLKNGNNNNGFFFESIAFLNILSNGKLVLLKDAIQTESSELFIIKPEFYDK